MLNSLIMKITAKAIDVNDIFVDVSVNALPVTTNLLQMHW